MTRRTRRLIWVVAAVLLLSGAYTGYWFWLARTFETNLALWAEQQRAMGYRIDLGASQPYGYPLSVKIDARDIAIEPPPRLSPWRFSTSLKVLSVAPWSPLSLQIADHPSDSVAGAVLTANGRVLQAATRELRIKLGLSTSGGPPSVRLVAQSISISENDRIVAGLIQPSFRLDLFQATSHEEPSAAFQFDACGINFPSQLPSVSRTIETYDWLTEGQVRGPFSIAPLPTALAVWSSNGGTVEFKRFEANWNGATTISANGTLALDGNLQPVFAGTVNVRGHNDAVDALAQAGMIELGQVTAAKIALAAMSKPSDDGGPPAAKLPITIQDGFLFVGPLKLAQMPRIVWQ
jgi:hypothetical protein